MTFFPAFQFVAILTSVNLAFSGFRCRGEDTRHTHPLLPAGKSTGLKGQLSVFLYVFGGHLPFEDFYWLPKAGKGKGVFATGRYNGGIQVRVESGPRELQSESCQNPKFIMNETSYHENSISDIPRSVPCTAVLSFAFMQWPVATLPPSFE